MKTCAECGKPAGKFKQWHNRDKGFSICRSCVWGAMFDSKFICESYGEAGVHRPYSQQEDLLRQPIKFKVGDTVYSDRYGEGVVTKVEPEIVFCLFVDFKDATSNFTRQGREFLSEPVTLFKDYPSTLYRKPITFTWF